jgi:hypothetical protein
MPGLSQAHATGDSEALRGHSLWSREQGSPSRIVTFSHVGSRDTSRRGLGVCARDSSTNLRIQGSNRSCHVMLVRVR